jgi:hypothetical protein
MNIEIDTHARLHQTPDQYTLTTFSSPRKIPVVQIVVFAAPAHKLVELEATDRHEIGPALTDSLRESWPVYNHTAACYISAVKVCRTEFTTYL